MSFATELHLGFILLFIDTAVMLQQEDQLRPYIDWDTDGLAGGEVFRQAKERYKQECKRTDTSSHS